MSQLKKPRCFLIYAHAPEGMLPSEANRLFNEFVADRSLPLVLFHHHFIGKPGGLAIFYIESQEDRDAMTRANHLIDWKIEIKPLIFSFSPSAFDEQIAYTLKAYRGQDWQAIRSEKRPSYGHDPRREAETAEEQ